MKTTKFWITVLILLHVLNLSSFAKKVALKLKFTPGDSTIYKLTEETEKQFDVEMGGSLKSNLAKKTIELTFRQEIESVNSNGNAIAKITIEKLKYYSLANNKVKIDFDSSRKDDLLKSMAKLIGQSYLITISPRGEVIKVDNAYQIRKVVNAYVTKINISPINKTNEYRSFGPSSPETSALKWFIGHDDFIKERHELLLLPETRKLKIGKSWDARKTLSIPPDSSEKNYILKKVEKEGNHQMAIAEMKNVRPYGKGIGEVSSLISPLMKTVSTTGYLKIDLNEGKIVRFKEESVIEGNLSEKKDGKLEKLAAREVRVCSFEKINKSKYHLVNYSKSSEKKGIQKTKKRDLSNKLGKIKSVSKVKFKFDYQGKKSVEDIIKPIMIDAARRVISKYSGLRIVQDSTDEDTVNIHIKAKAEALPIEYSGKEIRYTVISVTGAIVLENRDIVIEKPFKGESSRWDHTLVEGNKYKSPSDIFFDSKLPDMLEYALKGKNVFQDGKCFFTTLYEVTAEAFGPENIIPALKTQERKYAFTALTSLSRMHGKEIFARLLPLIDGSDEELSSAALKVIGSLILSNIRSFDTSDLDDFRKLAEALKHNDEQIRAIATQAVIDIIEGSIEDIQEWRQWWKTHKNLFSYNMSTD